MSFCSRGAPYEYGSNNADQSEDCNERSNPSPNDTSDVKCSHIKIDQNMKGRRNPFESTDSREVLRKSRQRHADPPNLQAPVLAGYSQSGFESDLPTPSDDSKPLQEDISYAVESSMLMQECAFIRLPLGKNAFCSSSSRNAGCRRKIDSKSDLLALAWDFPLSIEANFFRCELGSFPIALALFFGCGSDQPVSRGLRL